MNRLEYTRRVRNASTRARNAAEAVMFLAHVARERLRLEQERRSLEKRMRRIEARLHEIASAETRLVPVIQTAADRSGGAPARVEATRRLAPALSSGVMEVTLQY